MARVAPIDVLVVGSGAAGLAAAVSAERTGARVAVATKTTLQANNSSKAQGGIQAALGADDSPALHAEDVMRSSHDTADPELVEVLTSEAPDAIAWLEELGRYAQAERLPLHVHADEQPREVEECVAEHGVRPIELLADSGCLGERTTVVHATHANGAELDLLRDSGSTICVCPTTEADLGDGFLPAVRVKHRGIRLCIGSDSNVRVDPFEELRQLEGIARRQDGRRNVFATDELWEIGGANGASSLGLETWANVEVDAAHPSLAGVGEGDVRAALIAGCAADVVVPA